MDEFYLPEDVVEWIGLKKSEYLSKLIQNVDADDFQFQEYDRFEDSLPVTLSTPDWSSEALEDGHRLKTFCRSYEVPEFYQQVAVGVLVPDQGKNDVFVPIITFVTRKENLVKLFSVNHTFNKPTLN